MGGENVNRGQNRMRVKCPISVQSSDVTALLLAWRQGDTAALECLVPLVYDELHGIARRCIAGERSGHSLQATALVNEAYLRLVNVQRVNWQDRAHFFAMSARLMRRVLVDHARARQYLKRGGGAVKVTFDEALPVPARHDRDVMALDEALNTLADFDKRKSRVVELRIFAGLTVEETASILDVSADTVRRDWRLAKAWLLREMRSTSALVNSADVATYATAGTVVPRAGCHKRGQRQLNQAR